MPNTFRVAGTITIPQGAAESTDTLANLGIGKVEANEEITLVAYGDNMNVWYDQSTDKIKCSATVQAAGGLKVDYRITA